MKPSIELLVTNGADINAKNKNGYTPLGILLSKIDLLHRDILSNWELITWFHSYMKNNNQYTGVIKNYEQGNNLITAAIEGNIDIWRDWSEVQTNEELLKEWLRYGLFIATANGQINFFNDIYNLLTQYDSNIDLSTIRDNNGNNVIDDAFYSLNPEIIATIRSVNGDTFKDHLNTNVNKISEHLINLFLNKYSSLVREINNPRDGTNMNKLIEEMNDLIGNYIDICRYLINNFRFNGNIILQNLIGIINVDTTLTDELEKYNVKGQDIYNHINSLLN